MTTVPLGLAIDAAIEAAGGYDLDVTTLRYCSFTMEAFTSNRRALQATGRIVRLGGGTSRRRWRCTRASA